MVQSGPYRNDNHLPSLINYNDSRRLRRRYIWFLAYLGNSNWRETNKAKDLSTIIKISITEEFWEPQKRRKIVDHLRIADQAAKLKKKKTRLDFTYLRATYDTPYTKYTWTRTPASFFVPPSFPTPKFSCGNCDIEEDITTSERAFSLSPQFLDPVPFFFTVRSNTFIYFLIKVDLCTSCDKPGIALSFFIRSPKSVLLSFILSFLSYFHVTFTFVHFLIYLFFLSFFFYSRKKW